MGKEERDGKRAVDIQPGGSGLEAMKLTLITQGIPADQAEIMAEAAFAGVAVYAREVGELNGKRVVCIEKRQVLPENGRES